MLNITITSYDESEDAFKCATIDGAADTTYDMTIPASLMPYIAFDTCDECEDLPFDMIGKSFTLHLPAFVSLN